MTATITQDEYGIYHVTDELPAEYGDGLEPVYASYEHDTHVSAVNPKTGRIHALCPYCSGHHAHGVNPDLDFTGPDSSYLAYRVPDCPRSDEGRPSGTCYRIYDPQGLVPLVCAAPRRRRRRRARPAVTA